MDNFDLEVRDVRHSDCQRLANLIHFEEHVHRHLDWKPALDWIGNPPYLLAQNGNTIVAALACPPDPPGIAWVRLFAVASGTSLDKAWQLLWESACVQMAVTGGIQVYALTLQDWFTALIRRHSGEHVQDVIVLSWEAGNWQQISTNTQITTRKMEVHDLPVVCELDGLAFGPEWRNSLSALGMALEQAAVASVAVLRDEIIGYQISTSSPMGGHLARLAVHPAFQGQGAGTVLVKGVLEAFYMRGMSRVTVNTQADNHASLAIYQKTGFQLTDEAYPVFRLADFRS